MAVGAPPHLYISIDKDVLAPADALTNWGAGDLPLADLLAWLRLLGQHRRAIRLNEAANLSILEALAPALH